MKKIILLALLIISISSNAYSEFGTTPFGRPRFSGNCAFGIGPFGNCNSGSGAPGDIVDDSGNLIKDDSGNFIIDP